MVGLLRQIDVIYCRVYTATPLLLNTPTYQYISIPTHGDDIFYGPAMWPLVCKYNYANRTIVMKHVYKADVYTGIDFNMPLITRPVLKHPPC